jgi:16S rRNA (cytosine1402-N4)-methyltransferase
MNSDKTYTSHYSVQLQDCIDYLDLLPKRDHYNFMDGTFGGGGHTFAFAKHVDNSTVYSFDQDLEAFENGLKRIESENFSGKIILTHDNFENLENHLHQLKGKFQAIVLDLGVSSHHFDSGERGFSFRKEAKLDMRMNTKEDSLTAMEVINEYDEEDIADILFKYGEEKFARKIARRICEKREVKEITKTTELADIIKMAYPIKLRHGRIHPATKSFQALRILVNNELGVLEETLPKLFDYLDQDGLLMVISFHSLEDRIVKHCFKKLFLENKDHCTILTKKPKLPSALELEENNRSRSAKLRVLKKSMEELSEKKKKYQKFKKQVD